MTSGRGTQHSGMLISVVLLLLPILHSSIISGTSQWAKVISTSGAIIQPQVNVTLDLGGVIGANNLSLGFMLDFEWKGWRDSNVRRGLSQEANFKLVRVFDFRPTDPPLMPVMQWNESAKTGTLNWTNVDALVQKIFEIGAEPLICLGWARTDPPITNYIPPGMAISPATGLPYPDSYAAYAAGWAKHFKILGWPVRFYEIFDEPFFYFDWSVNYTRLSYFKDVWNAVARAMRAADPNVLLSFDFITAKKVLDYWIINGDDIDYLDSHKYDANEIPGYDDEEIFRIAETRRFEDDCTFYGFNRARQEWFRVRGKLLPTIISESNLNSACGNGTDPRIQQIVGAIRTSLVLRKAVLNDVNYHVYYSFSSSAEYSSGGYGFGMVNSDNDLPWYPYYVQQMFGNNLGIGDSIIETTSSSEDIRPLAWIHEGRANILIICKIAESRAVCLQGVTGRFSFFRIDNTPSFMEPQIHTGVIDSSQTLRMNGFTVILLQMLAAE